MALLPFGSPPAKPRGSDTEVQFNDGGAFAGDADFTFDKNTNTLSVNSITTGALSFTGLADKSVLFNDNGTVNEDVGELAWDKATNTLTAHNIRGVDDASMTIQTGDGVASTGPELLLKAGTASTGGSDGGNITLQPGDPDGAGLPGEVRIYSPLTGYYGYFNTDSFTADHIYTLPDATGTFSLVSSTLSTGAIPFANSSGVLISDVTNFSYNDSTDFLNISNIQPTILGGALLIRGAEADTSVGSGAGAITIQARQGSTTGSGGAGGAISITGGNAGGDDTVNRLGGSIAVTAGTSKGSNTGGTVALTGGTGGPGTGTTGAVGGQISIIAGTGGAGSTTGGAGANTFFSGGTGGIGGTTGGAGGELQLRGGNAAAAPGAAGGPITIIARNGSSTGTGGAGGAISIQPGSGAGDGTVTRAAGNFTITMGTGVGNGSSGVFTITGGTSGSGTGTGGAAGGAMNITASTGGSGSSTSGVGGNMALTAGTGGGAGTATSGAAGGTMTVSGGTGGVGVTNSGNGGAATFQGGAAAAAAASAGGAVTVQGRAGSSTGTGGAGGAASLIGGAAGGDETVSRVGGTVTITAGLSKGSSVGGAVNVTAGNGGSGTGAAGAVGGAITLTAGNGGTNATTGGVGGGVNILAGNATGAGNVAGGAVTIKGGLGANSGAGGAILFQTATTTGPVSTRLTIDAASTITVADAVDLVFNTTTGSKIGTATSQKIGFFNATPVIQQTGNIKTALSNLGLVTSGTYDAADITAGTLAIARGGTNQTTAGNRQFAIEATGMWPSTTSGCAALSKTETGTNKVNYQTLDFDQTTEEYAEFSTWMPDNWNAGTITFQVAWTAASGSGDVIWALQGTALANDDAIDTAWGTAVTVTDTLTAAADEDLTPVSSAVTLGNSPSAGERVQFRIYRDADAGGDTLNADAKLRSIKITYGVSTYGT